MKSSKIISMVAAIITIVIAGCNSSDNPGGGVVIPPQSLYDFATLFSTNNSGSVFTLNKANDSQTITYSSTVSLASKKDVKPGDRLIIVYTTTDGLKPYESGPINLIGYILLNNASTEVSDLTGNWSSSPVKMDMITRTGTYINMQLQLYARNNSQRGDLMLMVDPATIDQPTPELYLVFDNDKNSGDNQYLAYASFNISEIWTRRTCRAVKVTYQTPDGIKSTTFNNNDVVTPEPME